jgi:hypothetical protein
VPKLLFSPKAAEQLKCLEGDGGLAKRFKAVRATLAKMERSLRYPGLHTHELVGWRCPHDDKLFEAYAENRTPSAYRVAFCYMPPPPADTILIVAIFPHL